MTTSIRFLIFWDTRADLIIQNPLEKIKRFAGGAGHFQMAVIY